MKGSKKLVVLYTRINGVERMQVEPEFAVKDKRDRGVHNFVKAALRIRSNGDDIVRPEPLSYK